MIDGKTLTEAEAALNSENWAEVIRLLEPVQYFPTPKTKGYLVFHSKPFKQLKPFKADLTPRDKTILAIAYNGLYQFTKALRLLKPVKDELPLNGKSTLVTTYLNLGQFSPAIKFVKKTNKPVVTKMFMAELLTQLKNTLLGQIALPLLKDSVLKTELVALFFNTYLKLKLDDKTLAAEQESLFNQICVLALLKLDDIPEVSYYCSADAYNKIFKPFKEGDNGSENSAKLCMIAASKLNDDPLEGKMLGHHDVSSINRKKIFIKCFRLHHNNLNQFRLYGGTHGRANGVSLGFKPTFFSGEHNSLSMLTNLKEQQLPLFRVCYLDSVTSSGQKSYQIHGLATPDFASYLATSDFASYLADNPTKKRKDYEAEVLTTHDELIACLEPLLAKMGKIYIPFFPYLFKDKGFLDEAECRIIDFKDKTINTTNESLIWYEVDILKHLSRVDLGPNFAEDKRDCWQNYFKKYHIAVNLNADGSFLIV